MRFRQMIRAASFFLVVAVSSSVVQGAAAESAPAPDGGPEVQRERSVPGHAVEVSPLPRNDMPVAGKPEPVRWPAAARSEVDVSAAARSGGVRYRAAGTLPVRVGRVSSARATAAVSKVVVETFDQSAAGDAGLAGTLLRVADAGGAAGERMSVQVDYSGFGQAYGGDYGSRLYLAELPACVLTTPRRPECRAGTPLPSNNHVGDRTVTAEVTLPAVRSGASVLAVAAADSGSGGSYAATDLAPSGSWSAGGSSGDFTYSVPLVMPAAPGGMAPSLAFGYSSGGVDGRTSATNSQASWVGDGWDITAGGFIERGYVPCAEDKGNQGSLETGDLCWKGERYTLSLGGMSGKLVRSGNGWRPEQDDGSRIEKLADTATANGDDNGEYWKVTAPDGTQYFLGRNRLPGWENAPAERKVETGSVFTAPVYGNHTGEPCGAATFAASSCQQAYRWNVDLVIDPRGNAMTFHYAREYNHYKRGGTQGVNTSYVASGQLARIAYGLRADALFDLAPARVVFQTANRCAAGDTTCDVPFDRVCDAGVDCVGKYSPSFFTRLRLNRVVTQSLDGGTHRDVDSWTLRQSHPPTGDGMPRALWLDGITHTGHVGGTASLPEIQFIGTAMDNRVDTVDNYLPITRYRLTRIIGSAGAVTEVTYRGECVAGSNMPANAHTNTMRCYPTWWTPQGNPEPVQDWFHKYVVTDVSEDSRTGGPSISKTHYDYLDGGAWHYDQNVDEDPKRRTWSDWRGYGKVRTVLGDPAEPRTVSETLYLRGMDGDAQPDGDGDAIPEGVRDVWVEDSEKDPARRIEDRPTLLGFTRETVLYSGGQVVSAELNEPNVIQTASDGGDVAAIVGTKWVASRSLREDGTTWRRTLATTTEFTPEGMPKKVDDAGDVGVAGDESCTETTYVRNETAWLLNHAARVRTVAKPCTVPGGDEDVVSDVLSAYDNQAHGVAPTRGVVTETKRWTGGATYQTVSGEVADAYGRVVESTDTEGKKTTTAYTPTTGNPTTVTTTNRVGWTTTSIMDPVRGLPLAEIGVNGERADLEYDPLGRLIRVWEPGWSKEDHPTKPTTEYSYEYRLDAPSVVTTRTIKEDETYQVSYDFYDGLLRPRQSQTPAANGTGRIVTDAFYNSRGQEFKVNGGYYNASPPSKDLHGVIDQAVPNQTVTEYDDLGRPLETILKRQDKELWRTTTRYRGDITYTTPPKGDTATAVFKDAHGRIVERRQYRAHNPTGVYGPNDLYDAMTYRYNAKGQLEKVADAQGNEWRYEYDLLGRRKADVDPDRGRTTYGYNTLDQLQSTTDAKNQALVYRYDDLGRPTAMYEGSVSDDTKLAEWTYDTLRKGQPTSATRFVGDDAYTQKVDAYDDLGRPTAISVVIPSVEGALANTYTYGASYSRVTGQLRSETIPKAGALPAENVVHEYNSLGLPEKTYGQATYASEHLYSPYGETLRITLGASPNKVWVATEYEEGTRRLQNFEIRRDRTTQPEVAKRTFTYDNAGNLTRIANLPAAGPADTQCFSYDHLRRMSSAWTPGNGDCEAPKSVAALGGAAPYWYDYTFDKIGNRATQVKHTAAGDETETYAVPQSGANAVRPHAVSSVTRTGPAGTALDEFTYDANGNTETRTIGGDTQTLEWSADGQLSKVTEADGSKSEYVYDANGNRLLKKEPNATTLYLPGQELVLAKGATEPTGKRYYSHGGATVAMRTSVSGLTYLLGDHHGTDEVAISASNLFVTRRYSDPYGETRGTPPRFWPDDKGFVGGVEDDSGLTSVGAREYDPATGRFTSVDPIIDFADPQQTNGYAYANNSPATFSDPTGLKHMADGGGSGKKKGGFFGLFTRLFKLLPKIVNRALNYKRVVGDAKNKACTEMGMSAKECRQMQKDAKSNKGFFDIMKEELPDLIGDITGFNDAKACFTELDLWACTSFIPWKRVVKLFASAGRVIAAVNKAIKWEKRVSAARSLMNKWSSRVNQLVRDGMAKVDDLFDKKGAKVPDKPAAPEACHSFPPGTRVLLADGTTKPIEQVKLGDKVLTADPEKGHTEARKVVGTWVHDDEPQRTELTIDTDGAQGSATATMTATDWHPVWEPELAKWVPIGKMKAGSWLQTSSGTWVQVTAVRHHTGTGKVHDLTVQGVHSYHVVTGSVATLVHNCPAAAPSPSPSPSSGGGEAIVHLDPQQKHALVTIKDGDEVLSTHQFGGINLPTNGVETFDTKILSPTTINVRVPLPNPQGAMAYAEVMMDRTARGVYPGYHPVTQSCVTYCMNVLEAGGIPGLPKTTVRGTRWLLEHHG